MLMSRRLGLISVFLLAAVACGGSGGGDDGAEQGVDAVTSGKCVKEETLTSSKSFDDAMAAWIQSSATDLADKKAFLARLEAIVGDNTKVVGFGEPDHGFHEFAAIRNDVFKMLVEKKDLRAITLETGIIEARLVDQYVTDTENKSGITLDDVLKKGFTHDMGEWEETADLVKWVKDHNVQAARAGKPLVHWGGKDLTVEGDTLTVPVNVVTPFYEKVGAAYKLTKLDALSKKASEVTAFVKKVLKEKVNIDHIDPDHLDAVCSISYDQLTAAEQNEIKQELASLIKDIDSNEAEYAQKAGKSEVAWTKTMLRVAQQIQEDLDHRVKVGVVYGPTNTAGTTSAFLARVYGAVGQPVPTTRNVQLIDRDYTPKELETYQTGREIREKHLAENVDLLVKEYGKTFNFAASSHVQKARMLADGGNAAAEGMFIEERYGKNYVVIGGTASTFDVPALTGNESRDTFATWVKKTRAEQAARPGSFERRLEGTSMNGFIIDLRKDPTCSRPSWVTDYLKTPQLMWVGTSKFDTNLKDSFDAIYWVRHATFGHRRGGQ
jgi:erythromycin esterase-like protein